MLFQPDEEEQEKNDYFESSGPAEEPVREPKKPAYKPEDPDYWEEEESEWEHLKPRRSMAPWLWLGGAFVIVALMIGIWLRFFSPYIDEASQVGYVENIERRGTIFNTYEGVLIPYKEIFDTTRIYTRDFIFTAADEQVAIALKKASFDVRPVRVSYKRYHGILPWRGSSKTIVTAVDSVDPQKILPPEFAPKSAGRWEHALK